MELLSQTIPEFESYLTSLQEKGRRPSTLRRYFYDLEDFYRWCQMTLSISSEKVTTITTKDLQLFFTYLEEERNYDTKTIKRFGTVLKQFYMYLVEAKVITTNPFIGVVYNKESDNHLKASDIISELEQQKLLASIRSPRFLTDNQLKARPFLNDRNESMIRLLLLYGLTLQELTSITMKDVHFEVNTIDIITDTTQSRPLVISNEDKQLLYTYYTTIPTPVRPRYYSDDPFFVAFDFQRNTYRWSYEIERPKALTDIAVQKMIRQEVRRASLRKGISAKHFRHTFAVQSLKNGLSLFELQEKMGLKTGQSLERYLLFLEQQY
ncbi:tyrosine-type recombinase/integrase [Alkalihalobacillus sp. LMS39]|uniref:tyrosine-type recombinase/integrase n=1 Tax=Alkalihalobacillus sp. LMS39 TaxID=2924032 RepID=UPI001FB4878A|nr:tyrosine-type recombinase/integrase [Alkalihalobacillus sp. LMS39]UOE92762.1 tyrosine-type recombinase/integrase [Alkalihalobacillus sp. LMS39]